MDLQTVVNILGWTALTYGWFEANRIFLASCLKTSRREQEDSLQARKQWLKEHKKYCVGCEMLKEMSEYEGKDK